MPPPDAVERNYVTPADTLDFGTIPKRALLALNALYADDVKLTSRLTGIDLDDWLSPDYRDIGDLASTGRGGRGKKAFPTQRRLTLETELYASSWRQR